MLRILQTLFGPFFILVNVHSVACVFAEERKPFVIKVVDQENGWPVPLVELTTTHHVRFVTDNAGVAAIDLQELMGVETWFHLRGHGYFVEPDGFGFRGVRVKPEWGKQVILTVFRKLPGKRLGRLTGGGLFAESQKLGEQLTWKWQGIFGCDSVQNAVHNGKLYWGWGDTTLANYPLGRFHMIGATTSQRPISKLEPPIALQYDYFIGDDQVPRNIAKMTGEGPTWLSGFASLPDSNGNYHLVATYSKIQPPLQEYERGLCIWNEKRLAFDKHKTLWTRQTAEESPAPAPQGHMIFYTDQENQQWALFGDPFPTLQCSATFEAWQSVESWRIHEPQPRVNTLESDQEIQPHRGAISWNAYRNRWVTVFTQFDGDSSHLGELWYAEAESPFGPWKDAIKVVTHDRYTFYNPQLHAEFVEPGSPILLFEATYTNAFSKTETPTPLYDYNQVLYRLDLDEMFD